MLTWTFTGTCKPQIAAITQYIMDIQAVTVSLGKLSYETTHPWLTFRVNLKRMPPAFWMLLGEVRSKSAHLSGVPLRPDTATNVHQVYLARDVLATTAIEGNTLSIETILAFLPDTVEHDHGDVD